MNDKQKGNMLRTPMPKTNEGFNVPASAAKKRVDFARESFAPSTGFGRSNAQFGRPSVQFSSSAGRQSIQTGKFSFAGNRQSLVRASLAGQSLSGRPSTAGGIVGQNNKRIPNFSRQPFVKDVRNISDKACQSRMIAKIYEFLMRSELNFQINEKMLARPSQADFRNVFEHIMRHLDETYTAGRLESEFPSFMLAFGYPYPIKNSMFQPIGASHSWYHLLAALEWLIDFIQLDDGQRNELNRTDELAYSYFTTCYKKKLQSNTEITDFAEELKTYRDLVVKNDDLDTLSNQLHLKRINNEKAIMQIQKEADKKQTEMANVESDIFDVETDISKLKEFVEKVVLSIANLEEEMADSEKQIANMNAELSKICQENDRKEALISAQKISSEEAKMLLIKRNALKEQLLATREQLYKFEAKSYELQPIFMKNNNQLKSQYNEILSSMQQLSGSLLSPIEAGKIDWNKFNYENLADEFANNGHKEVPNFIAFLKKLLDDAQETNSKKLVKIENDIADKKLLIRELENNKSQCELECNLKLEKCKREVEITAAELQQSQKEVEFYIEQNELAKSELNNCREETKSLKNEIMEVSHFHTKQSNDLERVLNDLKMSYYDKLTVYLNQIQAIVNDRQKLQEIGERTLEHNNKVLKDMRQKNVRRKAQKFEGQESSKS